MRPLIVSSRNSPNRKSVRSLWSLSGIATSWDRTFRRLIVYLKGHNGMKGVALISMSAILVGRCVYTPGRKFKDLFQKAVKIHSQCSRADIAKFVQMPTKYCFSMGQLYYKVPVTIQNSATVGMKWEITSPLMPLRLCAFSGCLHIWSKSIFRHWAVTSWST